MNYLIPYIHSIPPDPLFDEYTYGDSGRRARKLKNKVDKGDYLFFHTSIRGQKFITAFYLVEKVMDTVDAARDKTISMKYENHHIHEMIKRKFISEEDVLVFGNSVESYILLKPLPFDKQLAEKLSLNIKFLPDRTEKQAIVWSTRAWRELTQKDVNIIKTEIERYEKSHPIIKHLMSSDEVFETLERDIEDYLVEKPELLGKDLKFKARQERVAGGRLDLLFEKTNGDWVVVEIKLNRIGRHAIRQVKCYVKDLQQQYPDKKISGILVGSGVMPAFEEELLKQTDMKILVYGWDLQVRQL